MIYSRSSRNLPAGPSTRAPRTGYPNSSRDPPFLVLSRFLRSKWLSPISSFYAYALNFRLPSIPFPERSPDRLSLSPWLPRPVSIRPGRCFSDSRELANVRLLLTLSPIVRFLSPYLSYPVSSSFYSLLALRSHAYSVSFTYLVTYSLCYIARLTAHLVRAALTAFHDGGLSL